jgi:hypothetical protein
VTDTQTDLDDLDIPPAYRLTSDPVEYHAALLCRAWQAVWCAVDPDAPTMLVEVFDRWGIRLVATDSYIMLWAFVPAPTSPDWETTGADGAGSAPRLDEAPGWSFTVADPEGLGQRWAAHYGKPKRVKGNPTERVSLALGTIEDAGQPTLSGDLAKRGAVLSGGSSRVLLPLIETVPLAWAESARAATDRGYKTRPRGGGWAFRAPRIVQLGRLAQGAPDAKLALTFCSPQTPVLVHLDMIPPVDGLVVPWADPQRQPEVETRPLTPAEAGLPEPQPFGEGLPGDETLDLGPDPDDVPSFLDEAGDDT